MNKNIYGQAEVRIKCGYWGPMLFDWEADQSDKLVVGFVGFAHGNAKLRLEPSNF